MADDNALGGFLRDRRARLDPAAFGIPLARRRTPGLRREEVAQRANVSATWYTWLEQGRGGAASADVLDRIARALMLTEAEREHLFLLGLGRPPETRYRAADSISPRLQGVLDALPVDAHGGEVEATAWAWAATVALGLAPSVLFHEGGYHGRSAGLVQMFSLGVYPGAHGLVKAGLAAAAGDGPAYPAMRRWLRE